MLKTYQITEAETWPGAYLSLHSTKPWLNIRDYITTAGFSS